jgi:hypothetical protein
MARKKKKVIKKKPARIKTKVAPSKVPGVDLDVMLKRKPAKKVVKTKIKKPKADTLPPMIIPLPPKRKIPKDITKRTSPKRKVPMRKSAVERERRVKFAKDHPLMQRKQTPPSLPTRLRGRPALDTSMLLSPLGVGTGLREAGTKGVKAVRKKSKKNR